MFILKKIKKCTIFFLRKQIAITAKFKTESGVSSKIDRSLFCFRFEDFPREVWSPIGHCSISCHFSLSEQPGIDQIKIIWFYKWTNLQNFIWNGYYPLDRVPSPLQSAIPAVLLTVPGRYSCTFSYWTSSLTLSNSIERMQINFKKEIQKARSPKLDFFLICIQSLHE